MSTTIARRGLPEATRDAWDFQTYFAGLYDEWEVAGSVRRRRLEVGDVEHVVIPRDGFWPRLEELTHDEDSMFGNAGTVFTKAVYPNGTHRWGPTYRGVMFRGFRHEIFAATIGNFGPTLAIRTGPAAFSQMLVTALHRTRLRQRDGHLVHAVSGQIVSCPTERQYFEFCNVPWREPWERDEKEHP